MVYQSSPVHILLHAGAFAAFQNKMTNARGRGWARLELTKPLRSTYAKQVGTCTVKTRSH